MCAQNRKTNVFHIILDGNLHIFNYSNVGSVIKDDGGRVFYLFRILMVFDDKIVLLINAGLLSYQ